MMFPVFQRGAWFSFSEHYICWKRELRRSGHQKWNKKFRPLQPILMFRCPLEIYASTSLPSLRPLDLSLIPSVRWSVQMKVRFRCKVATVKFECRCQRMFTSMYTLADLDVNNVPNVWEGAWFLGWFILVEMICYKNQSRRGGHKKWNKKPRPHKPVMMCILPLRRYESTNLPSPTMLDASLICFVRWSVQMKVWWRHKCKPLIIVKFDINKYSHRFTNLQIWTRTMFPVFEKGHGFLIKIILVDMRYVENVN